MPTRSRSGASTAPRNYKNFYTEGGYYAFEVDRKRAQPDVEFDGWYAALSWVLTGEPHRYDPARACVPFA